MFLSSILEQKENKARGKKFESAALRAVSRPPISPDTTGPRFAFRTASAVDCRQRNADEHCTPAVRIGNRSFCAILVRVGGSKPTLQVFPKPNDSPMPEADHEGQRYAPDQRQETPGFYLKGSHQPCWGMKNGLARVFDPASGRTVMLAVDHGYFQGPTSGLERIDLSIVPLLPFCDALFCTRGILRSVIPAQCQKPMVLRASGGPSILRDE